MVRINVFCGTRELNSRRIFDLFSSQEGNHNPTNTNNNTSNKMAKDIPGSVRESSSFIASRSVDVQIKEKSMTEAAHRILTSMLRKNFDINEWASHPLHPSSRDGNAIQFVFVVDVLNFCFWSPPNALPNEKYTVCFKGNAYTGYWSLCAALQRALEEGTPILDANFLAESDEKQWNHIFRSDTPTSISLLAERVQCVREAGAVLRDRFEGRFENAVRAANKSVKVLLNTIVSHFPRFRDEVEYHVPTANTPSLPSPFSQPSTNSYTAKFYKRAQILVADVWGCMGGEGIAAFHDISDLTMFADYRVPQALVGLGILEYSQRLHVLLSRGTILEHGSTEEIEIRGCSIHGVELLRAEIHRLLTQRGELDLVERINSVIIDFLLWDTAKENPEQFEHIPIHRVYSIYY
jgi:hypothetical protein